MHFINPVAGRWLEIPRLTNLFFANYQCLTYSPFVRSHRQCIFIVPKLGLRLGTIDGEPNVLSDTPKGQSPNCSLDLVPYYCIHVRTGRWGTINDSHRLMTSRQLNLVRRRFRHDDRARLLDPFFFRIEFTGHYS